MTSEDTSSPSDNLKTEIPDIKEEVNEKPFDSIKVENNELISIEVPSDPQCYCGKQRDFNEPDFQCSACLKWFHLKCITFNVGSALPFMTTYHFMCKNCNHLNNTEEVFSRKQANFAVMCQTALANLILGQNGKQAYFSCDSDIIPFLEKHWEVLTTQPRKTNKTWHVNIQKTVTSSDLFKTKEENTDLRVTLANSDLNKMGPSYDRFRALASQLKTDISKLGITGSGAGSRKRKAGMGIGTIGGTVGSQGAVGSTLSLLGSSGNGQSNPPLGPNSVHPCVGELAVVGGVGSGTVFGKSRRGQEEGKAKLNQFGFPTEHPYNKDGYRYILVEPDPHAPNRQTWDECEHTAGKPIPGYFYRLFLSPSVLLSMNDRAHQLKLADSQMSVTGEKGYSMIRATHFVNRGSYYYEVTILDQPESSHTRIGWSQMLGCLQAPCGYDKFSYSYRSRYGTAFHQSKGYHYGASYGKNDVIGCLIRLPDPTTLPPTSIAFKYAKSVLPDTFKDRPLIKFKNSYYFEEKDENVKAEKELTNLFDSEIVFYKNGINQGVAFKDIYGGSYYPAISLYKSVTVSVNFGPEFKFPPADCSDWKPMSDRVSESEIDQCLSDVLHLLDKRDKIESMLTSSN